MKITDKNPFLDDGPHDNLLRCADALAWIDFVDENQQGTPNDDLLFGKSMLIKCITDAIRYEAAHAPTVRGYMAAYLVEDEQNSESITASH